ncbi:hypothetical protein Egran_02623 [Elaphomyces granulatus]|uniref:Uncharacterized protein n=1 Tax=Elaphomyces granulatus TaxID=519963 RepID=A0A232LZT5_9EURO|nr:hypothetical protein Egran_02623 [Elaphomyces granulatus]
MAPVLRALPCQSHLDLSLLTSCTKRSMSRVSISVMPALSRPPTIPITISPPFPLSSATVDFTAPVQPSELAALAVARWSLSSVCRSSRLVRLIF